MLQSGIIILSVVICACAPIGGYDYDVEYRAKPRVVEVAQTQEEKAQQKKDVGNMLDRMEETSDTNEFIRLFLKLRSAPYNMSESQIIRSRETIPGKTIGFFSKHLTNTTQGNVEKTHDDFIAGFLVHLMTQITYRDDRFSTGFKALVAAAQHERPDVRKESIIALRRSLDDVPSWPQAMVEELVPSAFGIFSNTILSDPEQSHRKGALDMLQESMEELYGIGFHENESEYHIVALQVIARSLTPVLARAELCLNSENIESDRDLREWCDVFGNFERYEDDIGEMVEVTMDGLKESVSEIDLFFSSDQEEFCKKISINQTFTVLRSYAEHFGDRRMQRDLDDLSRETAHCS